VQFFHKHILLTTGLVHLIFDAGESGSSSTWDQWRVAALTSFIPASHIAKPTCNSISPNFLVTLFYKIEKMILQLFLFSLWERSWNEIVTFTIPNISLVTNNTSHIQSSSGESNLHGRIVDPLPILSSTSLLPIVGRQYSKFILAVGIAVAEQGLWSFCSIFEGNHLVFI
jgi:hypothetical protein